MQYEYDVCFSFAREQQNYVEQVYQELVKNNIRVFYDQDDDIETLLWGRNLIDIFRDIYRDKARFCVMFLSKEYTQKAWINHERHSALSRSLISNEAYILPVRFDDTDIPGLDNSMHYLNALDKTPVQIAEKIIKKLGYTPINIIHTPQEAIQKLASLLLKKIKTYNSQMVLISDNNSIKIFLNQKDVDENAYGAFIYCIKAGLEPEYKLIDFNIFYKNEETVKLSNILDFMDEVLGNE